jgi:hypothetical protein
LKEIDNKEHMSILLESPPYCPIDEEERQIWALLVGLRYHNVKIFRYFPKALVEFEYIPHIDTNTKKREIIDISWAFKDDLSPLDLVRKVFKDIENKKSDASS